jgi:hypothetical protein
MADDSDSASTALPTMTKPRFTCMLSSHETQSSPRSPARGATVTAETAVFAALSFASRT